MKIVRVFSSIAIAAIVVVGVMSCNKDVKVTGVQLDKATATVEAGSTLKLTATVLPADAADKAVTWSSDKPAVATVAEGLVTAKAEGTATITVTTKDGGKTATCVVTVIHPAEPEMVSVEGGTFTMGCRGKDGVYFNDARPTFQVTLKSFKMAKYPVTQKQWVAVMGTNPSEFKGDDLPVEQVIWSEVQEFIQKLNTATGKNYRLPTEAEWEYAARGGNKSKEEYWYSGSNNVDAVAWHDGNSGGKTQPVGKKAANELGIYDMNGNVYEWCNDWYAAYTNTPKTNPTGPATGTNRVSRGGSWLDEERNISVAARFSVLPTFRVSVLGFRLVHD